MNVFRVLSLTISFVSVARSTCAAWIVPESRHRYHLWSFLRARTPPSLPARRRAYQQERKSPEATTRCVLLCASASPSADALKERDSRVQGVTLKIALDSTGAAADLAADKSERFTCAASLDMVHRLRRDSDAVLVGRNTIEVDNPSLTVRRNIEVDRQPLRVVLDPLLKLMPRADEYTVFTDGLPTVVYHSVADVDEALLDLQDSVQCVYMPEFDLALIVDHLRQVFDVRHLMVEGGPYTARLFLPLLDRVIIVKAPLCFKEPLAAGVTAARLQEAGLRYCGDTECGDDTIEYWSKPGLAWPTETLSDWP